MNDFTFMGSLLNGEAIFYSRAEGIAIEKDHSHLVKASPEEEAEIFETKSHLKEIIRIQKTIGGENREARNEPAYP